MWSWQTSTAFDSFSDNTLWSLIAAACSSDRHKLISLWHFPSTSLSLFEVRGRYLWRVSLGWGWTARRGCQMDDRFWHVHLHPVAFSRHLARVQPWCLRNTPASLELRKHDSGQQGCLCSVASHNKSKEEGVVKNYKVTELGRSGCVWAKPNFKSSSEHHSIWLKL